MPVYRTILVPSDFSELSKMALAGSVDFWLRLD
jgi:hypothetical protein